MLGRSRIPWVMTMVPVPVAPVELRRWPRSVPERLHSPVQHRMLRRKAGASLHCVASRLRATARPWLEKRRGRLLGERQRRDARDGLRRRRRGFWKRLFGVDTTSLTGKAVVAVTGRWSRSAFRVRLTRPASFIDAQISTASGFREPGLRRSFHVRWERRLRTFRLRR